MALPAVVGLGKLGWTLLKPLAKKALPVALKGLGYASKAYQGYYYTEVAKEAAKGNWEPATDAAQFALLGKFSKAPTVLKAKDTVSFPKGYGQVTTNKKSLVQVDPSKIKHDRTPISSGAQGASVFKETNITHKGKPIEQKAFEDIVNKAKKEGTYPKDRKDVSAWMKKQGFEVKTTEHQISGRPATPIPKPQPQVSVSEGSILDAMRGKSAGTKVTLTLKDLGYTDKQIAGIRGAEAVKNLKGTGRTTVVTTGTNEAQLKIVHRTIMKDNKPVMEMDPRTGTPTPKLQNVYVAHKGQSLKYKEGVDVTTGEVIPAGARPLKLKVHLDEKGNPAQFVTMPNIKLNRKTQSLYIDPKNPTVTKKTYSGMATSGWKVGEEYRPKIAGRPENIGTGADYGKYGRGSDIEQFQAWSRSGVQTSYKSETAKIINERNRSIIAERVSKKPAHAEKIALAEQAKIEDVAKFRIRDAAKKGDPIDEIFMSGDSFADDLYAKASIKEAARLKLKIPKITKSTTNVYYGSGENKELSNLALRPFKYQGREYKTVEHAYQTLKSGKFDEATYLNKKWGAGVKISGASSDKTYVFADNIKGVGSGPKSGQAVIRGKPGAHGIPSKVDPKTYMTDANYVLNKAAIDKAIANIPKDKPIVISSGGIGTGRANLQETAPKTFDYLQKSLKKAGLHPDKLGPNVTKVDKFPTLQDSKVNKQISDKLMEDLMTESFKQNPKAMERLKATEGIFTHTQDKGYWGKRFPELLTKIRGGDAIETKAAKNWLLQDKRYTRTVHDYQSPDLPTKELAHDVKALTSAKKWMNQDPRITGSAAKPGVGVGTQGKAIAFESGLSTKYDVTNKQISKGVGDNKILLNTTGEQVGRYMKNKYANIPNVKVSGPGESSTVSGIVGQPNAISKQSDLFWKISQTPQDLSTKPLVYKVKPRIDRTVIDAEYRRYWRSTSNKKSQEAWKKFLGTHFKPIPPGKG